MSEAVLDWDRTVHKNVRSEDNQSVGNIVAVDDGHIIVMSQSGRGEYCISKSQVEAFNGAEIFLSFPAVQLGMFKL